MADRPLDVCGVNLLRVPLLPVNTSVGLADVADRVSRIESIESPASMFLQAAEICGLVDPQSFAVQVDERLPYRLVPNVVKLIAGMLMSELMLPR